MGELPPDVARSWDRIRRLSLQLLAGAALPDDLPRLARELINELEERRRLILTSRRGCARCCPGWPENLPDDDGRWYQPRVRRE